jgi:copper resistance protein B
LLLLAAAASPAAGVQLVYADLGEAEPELTWPKPQAPPAKGPSLQYVLFDRLEWAPQRGRDGYGWDFSLLWAGERNGLWLGSVGEGGLWGTPDYLETQALYRRSFERDLSLNAGLRWDAGPAPHRLHAVLGGQWEPVFGDNDLWIGAFGYLSHKGELSGRLGAIYNHKLAARLYAQPSFELNASAADVPELGLGRGLAYAEAGLRVRYELARGFAPYLGVSWDRSLGRTARFARAAGEDVEASSLVVGVRSSWEPR